MNANDSLTLWDSYRTAEQRAGGPLPSTSTPLKTPRSHREPEEPNVTTIGYQAVETEQDENLNLCTSIQSIHIRCQDCRELKREIQDLRKTVEKQALYIAVLKKSTNLTSEMDSSESQHGNGSTASSSSKTTRVTQRVTPTKRQTSESSSSSNSTSSNNYTPIVRNILQQITPRSARTPTRNRTPTANRTPTGTPTMTRNVRPATTRTSSSSDSPTALVTPVSTNRRTRPPVNRIPQSEPLGSRPRHARFDAPVLSSPRQNTTGNSRRSSSRRRLFAEEMPMLPHTPPQATANENRRDLNTYHRTRSENAIEHLNISPVKDDRWAQACPPRVHLERNRPEFIERVEARQSIIRAASEKRAEIERKKRLAARAVASGQRSLESVSRDLFADSTAVRAFYEKDMKEITLKNIRKSQSYQNQIHQRIATVDKQANRIIAQTHSVRARSTSRPRHQY